MAKPALVASTLVAAFLSLPASATAQYFGRNKVQYDDFDFKVLTTEHFDVHYYPSEGEAIEDVSRMAERWYERFARTFQHEFERSKPLIFYANHPDFQQTNTLSGFLGEGTGGVTESLKNRVIMPLTGSYWDTDHVLGHELVHAFQYNIAQSRRGGGLQGLSTLPLWLIEGMAEYMSVGRDDPLTAMWLRDAIRRDELPTVRDLTRGTIFPYRYGQALMAYIGGTYGDDAVVQIYRRSLRNGFEGGVRAVLGMSTDTLSLRWKEAVQREYGPILEGRLAPSEQGNLLLAPSTGSGSQNLSPSISPDGRYLAYLSERDNLFTIDLYMVDAQTGEVIRRLSSAETDPHVDALRYIDSSGTWSPDGEHLAYVVTAGGDHRIVIVRTASGAIDRTIDFDEVTSVVNPAWSPDGRYLAFSGTIGGISDLFLYDLETDETVRLTDDKYADFHPAWSPDGTTLAFASDRGPETSFDRLTYGEFQITLIDVATREVEPLSLFGNVRHSNPQYAPDGRSLYFLSDQDGVADIYRLDFQDRSIHRITNVATGVSGHTYMSPAMSVAANTGRIAYSVFDEVEFHVYTVDPEGEAAPLATVVENAHAQPGRKLPPVDPDRFSRVATYLDDAETGLVPPGAYPVEEADDYEPSLTLDFVGQPSIGVGADTYYGNYLAGGASAYFSDMLGNHVLGVAVTAQGTFRDIGGQLIYADLSDRWNWMVGAGRIPVMFAQWGVGADDLGPYWSQTLTRIYVNSLEGRVAYPFSTTRRFELSMGATRYSYYAERDKMYIDPLGRIIGRQREQVNFDSLGVKPLNLVEGSAALVGDNSFFGFVSPIRGGRYRLQGGYTTGTVDFATFIADARRYYSPTRNLTVAVRGLHYGRYGLSSQENAQGSFGLLRPLFLGYEYFIRGYAWESFTNTECELSALEAVGEGATGEFACPALDRLFGQRLGLASFEFRVPLIGVEQYGLINFPFLPTELVLFADGGLAWDDERPPTLQIERSRWERVPVFSTGASARINILGVLGFEAYYAYPFQRPDKGWHWGFQLAWGW